MQTNLRLLSLLSAAALSISITGNAIADNGPLKTSMDAYVITKDANGKEIAEKTTEVEPKQTVEFRATYKNMSNDTLENVVISGPIPKSTHYQAGSAKTQVAATFEVSIDGGKTFESEPVKRMRKSANGEMIEVIIPASEYTNVRWIPTSGIAGNETQYYSYRVSVE